VSGTRPASVDALASRTLVKGEALAAPAGRADDFSWPRRDIGRLEPGKDVPIAATPAKAETPPVAASRRPTVRHPRLPFSRRRRSARRRPFRHLDFLVSTHDLRRRRNSFGRRVRAMVCRVRPRVLGDQPLLPTVCSRADAHGGHTAAALELRA